MRVDILVVGSGIAGLSFALKAGRMGWNVCVVTKKEKAESATNLAQGGIAAVLSASDSFESHIQDTIAAGAGLCDEKIVRMVVEKGPERIDELLRIGVRFNREKNGQLSLGREGGHSARRVAHANDLTGREVERALVAEAARIPNIAMLENHMCVDLALHKGATGAKGQECAVCCGGYVLNQRNEVIAISAKVTILCTGGAGKVYLYTSNPDIATGDGIAIACRAGAEIKHMEFVQFHPTCLYHHRAKNFLISEAVRGEGAVLLNQKKERFLVEYEPEQMELATRDKVARAIDTEMKKTGADCVYLDISHRGADFIQSRFPAIYEKCLTLGIDMTVAPIPVVPAAHYLCGGVTTDKWGRSSIRNLLALGETACTGLHGGNRLASNSLLEALVFAENAFQYCTLLFTGSNVPDNIPCNQYPLTNCADIDEEILINHNWDIIRRTMWNYVGIVRKQSRLLLAEKQIREAKNEIDQLVNQYKLSCTMLELRNIGTIAELIIGAAIRRKKSCGLHYILDETSD